MEILVKGKGQGRCCGVMNLPVMFCDDCKIYEITASSFALKWNIMVNFAFLNQRAICVLNERSNIKFHSEIYLIHSGFVFTNKIGMKLKLACNGNTVLVIGILCSHIIHQH